MKIHLRRRLGGAAILFAFVLALLPLSAQPKPVIHAQETDLITIGTTDLTSVLDPALAIGFQSWELLSHLYTGLTRQIPGTSEYELALAESYAVSPDGLTYTFTLRTDLTFNDGTPITADTFVYSIMRVMNLERDASQLMRGIVQSVSVDANGALVFQLQRPVPYFLGLLALPPFFPVLESEFSADDVNVTVDSLTGNGVYLLEEWSPGDIARLRANPNYTLGEAALTETIVLRNYATTEDLRQALLNREVDLAWRDIILSDAIDTAGSDPALRLEIFPSMRMWYLLINQRHDFADDPVVRQGVFMILDRQAIVSGRFEDYLTLQTSLVPDSLQEAANPLWVMQPNREAAEQLLRDAGYRTGGSSAFLTFATSVQGYGLFYGTVLSDISQQFFPVLTFSINTAGNIELPVFVDGLTAGDFIVPIFSFTPAIVHPDAYLRGLLHSEGELAEANRYAAEELDQILDQAARTTDLAEQNRLYRQAQAMIFPEYVIMPLWRDVINVVSWDNIGGIMVETNYFLHYDRLVKE